MQVPPLSAHIGAVLLKACPRQTETKALLLVCVAEHARDIVELLCQQQISGAQSSGICSLWGGSAVEDSTQKSLGETSCSSTETRAITSWWVRKTLCTVMQNDMHLGQSPSCRLHESDHSSVCCRPSHSNEVRPYMEADGLWRWE